MTELERRRQALEKVRAKHPEIRDEIRLNELAEQYLKRQSRFTTGAFLLFPPAAYILVLRRVDQKHVILCFFLVMYAVTALALLVPWLKKRRREISGALEAPVTLSRANLSEQMKSSGNSVLLPVFVMLLLALVWWMSKQNGNPDTLQTWLLIWGVGSAIPWLLWFLVEMQKKKKNRELDGELASGELRVVCDSLADKEAVDVSTGKNSVYHYFFYFRKTGDEGCRKLQVGADAYKNARLGEEYYLIYLNGRLLRAFPKAQYRLDMELTQLIGDDPDSVGETHLSGFEEHRAPET